jgi:hypothetical protein
MSDKPDGAGLFFFIQGGIAGRQPGFELFNGIALFKQFGDFPAAHRYSFCTGFRSGFLLPASFASSRFHSVYLMFYTILYRPFHGVFQRHGLPVFPYPVNERAVPAQGGAFPQETLIMAVIDVYIPLRQVQVRAADCRP